MANVVYENFYLSNEVEDQFNSHLDLMRFVTVDNSLVGTAGMKRIIHRYSATNGTEKLAKGVGNSKSIEVSYVDEEYVIALAQNRFTWNDEDAMTDNMLVPVGMKHAGTDLFNTVNADIFAEFRKATLTHSASALDFGAIVDTVAKLNMENPEGVELFGFVCPLDVAKLRKALKDDLKYVEAFARTGYIGTVGGVHLYTKKDAVANEIIIGTKEAVTFFNKKGVEVEQERDANTRVNDIYSRKYYIAALTDESKVVKLTIGA
jgi:hypothetical protein